MVDIGRGHRPLVTTSGRDRTSMTIAEVRWFAVDLDVQRLNVTDFY